MNVHSLFLYPVKSLAGIQVRRFELDEFGPRGDRRWMLIDPENQFVSQRELPVLARVATSLENGVVTVTVPGQGVFPLQPGHEQVRVAVWRDWADALVGPDDANRALSRFCGVELRLVYMPDTSFRRVDPGRVFEHRRVGFADGFPFLLANLASLDELNTRLEQPVTIRRFRPNVVISGARAWSEDSWRSLIVGQTEFEVVKPCSRCVLTTVDPDTGEKHPTLEPLRTLARYRKTPEGVIFGQNAIHNSNGPIEVGDAVEITREEP